ncbi:MAG: hypothetical protein GXZ09_03730 [Syntrophomonadaceae bacterium]|jgi:hypothetical protein|nr:hypothetical protein [Syntrophomonadaceae bacterium]
MNKGDMFTIYLNGVIMTVCILGVYREEYSGEEMVILGVIEQENMIHVPLNELESIFQTSKFIN